MESEIRNVIKAKGFTLEQVASQMENKNGGKGISQSALTQMLNGNPSISRVMEIAKIVGVSVSELVGDAPVTRGAIVGATITCPHCKKDIYLHIEDKDYKDYGNDPHDIALMAAEPGPDDRK
jgi:transcriptional regulator with XRE-family HTH domain